MSPNTKTKRISDVRVKPIRRAVEEAGKTQWFLVQHSMEADLTESMARLGKVDPRMRLLVKWSVQTVKEIMAAPSMRDFRKGRLPGQAKPFSKEKRLAAFLLATKNSQTSLQSMANRWTDMLFNLLANDWEGKKSALGNLVSGRRAKILRKWRAEPRFQELINEYQQGFAQSLLEQLVDAVFLKTEDPIRDRALKIRLIGSVVNQMEKPLFDSFMEQLVLRYEGMLEADRTEGEALALAGFYAIGAFERGIVGSKAYRGEGGETATKICRGLDDATLAKLNRTVEDRVNKSFSMVSGGVRQLAGASSKKERATVAASLEALLVMRQIALMTATGMFDIREEVSRRLDFKKETKKKGRPRRRKD